MCIKKILPLRQTIGKCASALAFCSVFLGALPAEAQQSEKPNLRITSQQLHTSRVEVGQETSVSFKVANIGKGDVVNNFNVYYYLSDDQQVSTDDYLLSQGYWQSLASSGIAEFSSVSLNIPSSFSTGGRYLLISVAVDNPEDAESNETDNLVAMPITLLESTKKADLVVRSVSLDEKQRASSESVSVSFKVFNIGSGDAGDSEARVSLYKDGVQYQSNNFSVSSIAAGESEDYTFSITVDDELTSGFYSVRVLADEDYDVAESNETNNWSREVSLYVRQTATVTETDSRPNLVISNHSLSSTDVKQGESITVNTTVKNEGESYVSSSRLTLSLIKGTTTVKQSEQYTSSLSAGYDYARSTSISIPGDAVPGSYKLVLKADAYNWREESDENDNEEVIEIIIRKNDDLPNLALRKVKNSTPSMEYGSEISLSGKEVNLGTGDASYHYISAYLSEDGAFDGDDIYLYDDYYSALDASTARDFTMNFNFYQDVPVGSYNLILIVDSEQNVGESNEVDNTITFPVVVNARKSADLAITTIEVDNNTLANGQYNYVTTDLTNIGEGGANYSYIRFYLSDDEVLDNEDQRLADRYVGRLSPGQTQASIGFNVNTTLGTYYLFAVADIYDYVEESNETNNTAGPFMVEVSTPDLLIQNVSVSQDTIVKGNGSTISYDVVNQGAANARYQYVGFYISEDDVYDDGDTYFDNDYVSSVEGNSTYTTSEGVYLSVDTGTYYLFLKADYNDRVGESDEDNNVSDPVMITVTAADLYLENVTVDHNMVSPGTSLTVSYDIVNDGNADVTYQYTGFYLSEDDVYDDNDTYFDYDYISSIEGNSSYALTENITIPSNTSTGTYYLFAKADYYNGINEINEDDNVSNPIEIQIGYPDLVINNIASVSPTATVGGSTVDGTFDLVNQGTAGLYPSSTYYNIDIYISDDNTFDGSDQYIGFQSTNSEVDVNGSVPLDFSAYVDKAAGTYYLFVVADGGDDINEMDENNNVSDPLEITVTNAVVRQESFVKGETEVGLNSENGETGSFGTLQVYPNPTNGVFFLQGGEELAESQVTITDIFGKIVYQGVLSQTQQNIDLADRAAGIYNVSISNNLGTKVHRIIKQ